MSFLMAIKGIYVRTIKFVILSLKILFNKTFEAEKQFYKIPKL